MMIPTQDKVMMSIGQSGGDGSHLDDGTIKLTGRCPMWAIRSPRRSAMWCRNCIVCWSCDHVGDNKGSWVVAGVKVMVVIEMVVDK